MTYELWKKLAVEAARRMKPTSEVSNALSRFERSCEAKKARKKIAPVSDSETVMETNSMGKMAELGNDNAKLWSISLLQLCCGQTYHAPRTLVPALLFFRWSSCRSAVVGSKESSFFHSSECSILTSCPRQISIRALFSARGLHTPRR